MTPLEKEVRRDERDDAASNPLAWQQLLKVGCAPPSGSVSEGIGLLRNQARELREALASCYALAQNKATSSDARRRAIMDLVDDVLQLNPGELKQEFEPDLSP